MHLFIPPGAIRPGWWAIWKVPPEIIANIFLPIPACLQLKFQRGLQRMAFPQELHLSADILMNRELWGMFMPMNKKQAIVNPLRDLHD